MAIEILSTGMISGLANTAEANAALMRLEYDCFQNIPFQAPETSEDLIGGIVESIEIQGVPRLVEMADVAIRDAIQSAPLNNTMIDIIFCLPKRIDRHLNLQLEKKFNHGIQKKFGSINQAFGYTVINECFYYHEGRTGFIDALAYAQQRLVSKPNNYLMIVGVDSLINNENISMLLGNSDSDYPGRLVVEGNPDGMIIGEAAGAILLKASSSSQGILLTGVGIGREKASLFNYDQVSRSDGLVEAVQQAVGQAGTTVGDTDYRIGAVTGESYFFTEDSTMIYRCIDKPKAYYDLWHTTDKIGEVGAATGPAMVIMAYWAARKAYAPGNKVLCHISSEHERRGAFVLENKLV